MNSDVQELEENRRAELEFQMLIRQVAIQHGYGTHQQLHPGRVLKAAGLGENAARCGLAFGGSQLDCKCLAQLLFGNILMAKNTRYSVYEKWGLIEAVDG
jgi:hypothetical protein